MISTCQCDHCGAAVEFELDNWQPGAIGDCPHCHQETALKRIEIFAPPKNVPKNRGEIKPEKAPPKWYPVKSGAELIFFIIGFIILGVACLAGAAGAVMEAIYAGLGSSLWFGFAFVLGHLRNIAEKPQK